MSEKLSVTDPMANISDVAPKTTKGDVAHTVVKAAIASVPGFGGAAAEVFALIFSSPTSKRKDEWIESIVSALKELEERVDRFTIEALQEDESFITTLAQASQIAVRTHQAEKLTALKNVVLNSALQTAPEDDLRLIFLSYVDAFTEWHLRILKFLKGPGDWFVENERQPPNIYMGAPASVLESAYPELRGRRQFYDLLVGDLSSKGLLNSNSLHVTMTGAGTMEARTSGLGNQFIEFVSNPG